MKIIAQRDFKYIKFMVWFFVLLGALGLLLSGMQIKRGTFELVMGQAGLLGVLLLVSLDRTGELQEDAQKINKTAPLFIMAGFLLSWAFQWYREVVRQYGIAVAPGAGQVKVPDLALLNYDTMIIVVSIIILGPLLEEILFHFIGLGLVRRAIKPSRAVLFIGVWMMVISAIFALLHSPEPAAFLLYFISGIIYSLIYLKYGLFASILVHAAGNAGVFIF